MVFPYMDHDLSGLLENSNVKLTISQIKLYMKQLCEGVGYLHRVRNAFPVPPIVAFPLHTLTFIVQC
jgi:serine/threonine protein kinase